MSSWIAVVSTAYCLSGTMADGSTVRPGSVANNALALGSKITVSRAPTGRRHFVVRDRIGWGTQLDFWLPSCAQARAWGRRTVRIRRGWPRQRARVGPLRSEIAHVASAYRRLDHARAAGAGRDPDPGEHQPRLISASWPPSWSWPSWRRWP